MFHSILAAFDGSAPSGRALAEAVDLAQAQRALLTILTAVPHPPATASLAGVAAGPLGDELEAESHAILRRAADTVPDDVSLTTVLTRSPIRDALVEQAETGRFDVLVVGSRGRGAVRSALLGSVSHHLLNHSAIPMLVVHAEAATQPHDGVSRVLADAV